jgi:formiminoglutamase
MFSFCTKEQLAKNTSSRAGEKKLGEDLDVISDWSALSDKSQPFVLLGIQEDIGIRANLGRPGAAETWSYFLKAFCNVQSNTFLSGKTALVAGSLQPHDLMKQAATLDPKNQEDLKQLRSLTKKVDDAVIPIIRTIVNSGKTPIVIGGGHNNAYPIIYGSSTAKGESFNVLNIDPHADTRALEGRHSGNPFSYARANSTLNKYAVWGLHESYNHSDILRSFEEQQNLHYVTFESILQKLPAERDELMKNVLTWLGEDNFGLELDMDCMENMPASAFNVSGFSINEIRQMVSTIASLKTPRYFHICEAATGLTDNLWDKQKVGKQLTYIVTDFIKAQATWN